MAYKREIEKSLLIEEDVQDDEDSQRPVWSSKTALIFSCLGCVVGTGNIWRFPRIVARNSRGEGGLGFLIVWCLFLFLWSMPMLLIEYSVGRYTKEAIIGSFRKLWGDRVAWCGAFITFVTFAISCYYSVVLGWCFYYLVHSIGYDLPNNRDDSREIFRKFAEDSHWPVLTHGISVLIAGFSVIKGVKTIEKVNMVLVPLLLILILITFIWSLTQKYADQGIKFLFTMDWEALGDPRLWVDAASQNAFDTGAGMGLFIPYASYMTRKHGVVKFGTLIPIGNNIVSFICGLMIFGTVFSQLITENPYITQSEIVKILEDSGPASTGLTFIWIPVLFNTVGTFGRVLCVFFFLSLSFAGISSLISNFELVAHTLCDFGIPRKFGVPITMVVLFSVGLMSALNLDILLNQDFVWGFALLVSGVLLQTLVIHYGTAAFRRRVINEYGYDDWKMPVIWEWVVKFIAPLEALALLVWWAVDLIKDDTKLGARWYEMEKETFMVTIVQWLSAALIFITINALIMRCCPVWFRQIGREDHVEVEEDSSKYGTLRNQPSEPGHDDVYTKI